MTTKEKKHGNLGDDETEQLRKDEKKAKRDQHLWTLGETSSILNNVQMCSMIDPYMLTNNWKSIQRYHLGRPYLDIWYLLEVWIPRDCH